MFGESTQLMTARGSTSVKRAILSLSSWVMVRSERHTMMSGCIPMLRSSLTLCWVGLVFSSPLALMKGISVT